MVWTTNITTTTRYTGWATKERTAVNVWVIERDTFAYDALGLDSWRPPLAAAHFLQQQHTSAPVQQRQQQTASISRRFNFEYLILNSKFFANNRSITLYQNG